MQLHEQRDQLRARSFRAKEELTDLAYYLQSDKFQGDGNNFVNAREMFNRILAIRSTLETEIDLSDIDRRA